MKIKFTLLITALIILSVGCKKNKRETLYTGTVVRLADGCNDLPINDSTPNIPYVIKFDDINMLDENHPIRTKYFYDSSCAASNLPNDYKIIGKKIRFGFRELTENDRIFSCDMSVAYYQVILTKVSSNE